ncbi:hypothetical protein HU200_005089 [Digitaria exilis]|uniref:Transcription factor CBF/NF-Y/archaeal histone domain-containing protein n=1 Tax=Digitaria exilis TaxID=1010633 RepID=A0A835KTA0_9POAL|nr:hypothetical protein HU200_005089 [Digitaria exilis]CAB3482390.1 unnamed protein product [Digitaria exilis]
MEEQYSVATVKKLVTNGDTLAPSAGTIIPPASQDAAVDPTIQPQSSDQGQVVSHQTQQPHDAHKQQQLQDFWSGQLAEIKQTTEFKTHSLPLARIKKIMKDDSEVPRIAGEAPMLLAKASEMFIQELTLRAWLHTEEDKRRTLQKNDVTAALAGTEVLDFLVDIGSSDKPKDGGVVLPPPPTTTVQEEDDDPYRDYCWDDYSPPWSPDGSPGPDLRNVTCDDPRYYTYIHDYYSL